MHQGFPTYHSNTVRSDPLAPDNQGLFAGAEIKMSAKIIVVVSVAIATGKIAFIGDVDFKAL